MRETVSVAGTRRSERWCRAGSRLAGHLAQFVPGEGGAKGAASIAVRHSSMHSSRGSNGCQAGQDDPSIGLLRDTECLTGMSSHPSTIRRFESTMRTFMVGTSHSSSNLPISATGPVYTQGMLRSAWPWPARWRQRTRAGIALATLPRSLQAGRPGSGEPSRSRRRGAGATVPPASEPACGAVRGDGRQVGQDRVAGGLRQRTKSSEPVAMHWLRHYTRIRMSPRNAERQLSSLPWDGPPGADEVRDLVEQVEPDGSE